MRGKDRVISISHLGKKQVITQGERKCAWEGRRKGLDSLCLHLDSLDISSSFPGAEMLKIRGKARRKRTGMGHLSRGPVDEKGILGAATLLKA